MTQPIDPFLLTNPDVVCFDDVDTMGEECTSELQVLEQDVYHVIDEDLGSNPDDEERGIGISNYLSGTESDLQALPSIIDAQLKEDDRIDDSTTTVTLNDDGKYSIDIAISVSGSVYNLPYAYSNGVFTSGRLLNPGTPPNGDA